MRSRVLGSLIYLPGLLLTYSAFSQTVVSSGTLISTSVNTQIAFDNNMSINSNEADFSKATFILTGADQNLVSGRTGSPVVLGGLIVGVSGGTNNGTKNVSGGTWEIDGSILFEDGVVVPQTGSNGKIVHTIASGSPGNILVNNPLSYVNGTFYSKGKGTRFFPIGNNTGFFPSQVSDVNQSDVEIGMQVVNQNAALTHDSQILDIFDGQYWDLIDPSQILDGVKVALSSLGASTFIEPTIGTVIIGAAGTAQEGISFGGVSNGDFIVGSDPISTTDRIFTLGKISSELLDVVIRNVITPNQDRTNDFLNIENIEYFPNNKVKLLDRWGVLVREWSGFVNAVDTQEPRYNLSDLATGNYICIVEYQDGSNSKSLSQMITLINK